MADDPVRPKTPQITHLTPPARGVGAAVLSAVEPQPVEAGALRPVVPRGRQESRPQDVVPVPDPVGEFREGAGGVEGAGQEVNPKSEARNPKQIRRTEEESTKRSGARAPF